MIGNIHSVDRGFVKHFIVAVIYSAAVAQQVNLDFFILGGPWATPRSTWVCKIYRLTLTLTPLATLISFLEAELFSQALARASSLSYTAGMSDFDSINTFEKDKEVSSADDSSLEQARRAISDARTSLDKCLSILIQT